MICGDCGGEYSAPGKVKKINQCPLCKSYFLQPGQMLAALVDLWVFILQPGSNQAERAQAVGERPQSYHYIVQGQRSCSLEKARQWVDYWNDGHPDLRLSVESFLGEELTITLGGLTLDEAAQLGITRRRDHLRQMLTLRNQPPPGAAP